MPGHDKAAGGGAVKSLLSLLRFGKKKKEKAKNDVPKTLPTAPVEALPRAGPPLATAVAPPLRPPPAPDVVINTQAAATAKSAGAASDAPAARETQLGEALPATVQHDKLLAALDSTQNATDPHQHSARMSFNAADLSGMLFAHRTNTQSGTGIVLPPRMAEGTTSGVHGTSGGINSSEVPLQRAIEDGARGSYVPYATTTVAPLHSAAINTGPVNHDSSNALYSVPNNLQDMLFADYETLERIQGGSRQADNRGSAVGAAAISSAGGPRRDMKAPNVPLMLRPQAGEAQQLGTTPQLQIGDLTALQAAVAENAAAAAARVSAQAAAGPVPVQGPPGGMPRLAELAAAAHSSQSAPLAQMRLQQAQQAELRYQHLQQQQQQVWTPDHRAEVPPDCPPGLQLDGAVGQPPQAQAIRPSPQLPEERGHQQQQNEAVRANAVGLSARPACKDSGSAKDPATAAAAPPAALAATTPHGRGASAVLATDTAAAIAAAVAGPAHGRDVAAPKEIMKAGDPEVNFRRVPAPKPAGAGGVSPWEPLMSSNPHTNRAAALATHQAYMAHDFASLVAGPALPSYTQQPSPLADPAVPLSRPMRLTTACLSAYTTLYDNSVDQSFQRALQRKMQLVYKWMAASDLTAPPDPRLEVPLDSAAASDALGGGDGEYAGDGESGNLAGSAAGPDGSAAAAAAPATAGLAYGRGGEDATGAAGSAAARGHWVEGGVGGAQQDALGAGRLPSGRSGGHGPEPGAGLAAGEASLGAPGQRQPLSGAAGAAAATEAFKVAHNDHRLVQTIHHVTPSVPQKHPHRQQNVQTRNSGTQPGAATLRPPLQAGGAAATAKALPQGADLTAVAAAAAAGHQLQPLQHSLSDLYGHPQAVLVSNLPPRMLAGSEADPTSTLITTTDSVPGAAPAVASGAAPAADQPSGSRMLGRPTVAPEAPPSATAAATAAHEQHKQLQLESQQVATTATVASAQSSNGGAATPGGPGRTKTIAVASHCPPELQPQPSSASWTIDDFSLLKKLYEGSLSVVCQAQHKRSGRHVALKIYKRSRLHEMERFQLAREICLHIRIVHPHVVALYAAWKDSKYVYLALDWAPLGNMFDFLVVRGGRLVEEEAARVVMRPLMNALAFLHSQHFIHRDVKLENLLLDASNCLKLADFGLAIDQKFEQANTRLGTFGYFAPEVLDCPLKKGPFDMKDTPIPGYDSRVDVWSAGVVGYEVLTGRAPFSASSPAKIIQAIRSRVLEFPGISEEGRDFLQSALTRDPSARPTAKQLLNHPWILRHCGATAAASTLPPPMPTPGIFTPDVSPPGLSSPPQPPPPLPPPLEAASATVTGDALAGAAVQMVPLTADDAVGGPASLASKGPAGGAEVVGSCDADAKARAGQAPDREPPQTQLLAESKSP